MAKCAGKFKPFKNRQVYAVLLAAILLPSAAADAATLIDIPVFRLAHKWQVAPIAYPHLPGRGVLNPPAVHAMSVEERTAVETLLLEAAGDGFASLLAVGETIRNRSQLFNKSIEAVCLQPKQYSGWNDRVRAEIFLKKHQAYYGRAWIAWKLSAVTRLTQGATDYHSRDILPYWASAYTPIAQVGAHQFYVRQARRIREV